MSGKGIVYFPHIQIFRKKYSIIKFFSIKKQIDYCIIRWKGVPLHIICL